MKKLISTIIVLATSSCLLAQQVPTIIQGGTIHVGNGTVIENGMILIKDGKIIECGATITNEKINAATGNAIAVIDAKGKHIYPGLILLNTFMGLNEIDAVRATRDYAETGSINPNARTLVAYNTDSKVIPTALFNGVLMAQIVPQGGLVSGQSAIVTTSAWNWEDAVVKADEGIHINWPEMQNVYESDKQKEKIIRELQLLEELFVQAGQYSQTTMPEPVNLRLEAMRGLFNGSKKLYIHVERATDIIRALQFCEKYPQVKPVLVGASEALSVAEMIRQQEVPVILDIQHRLPAKNQDDVAAPYQLPAALKKAGVLVAIGHNGSWESRNVMFNAGTAAAYGLTKEEALQCITQNAAKICGVEDRIGTLEAGKDATLMISEGDVLDMKSNKIIRAFIQGAPVDLVNQQELLYRKYMNKYGFK
jgi:imidazolonepropionase-like amidohydrolase